jgi:hypothetical protein
VGVVRVEKQAEESKDPQVEASRKALFRREEGDGRDQTTVFQSSVSFL